MATYVIGDVHGAFNTLRALLKRIGFGDSGSDELWFTGDLVGRGPDSLSVLDWASNQNSRVRFVLGNHDLHLIACTQGIRKPRPKDRIDKTLEADKGPALIRWLAERPLVHYVEPYLLVHAGLLPDWTEENALSWGKKLSRELRHEHTRQAVLKPFYKTPAHQQKSESLPEALTAMTRMRMVQSDGRMDETFKSAPEEAPKQLTPWFDLPTNRRHDTKVLFGHWAALGLRRMKNAICIDAGCGWGRELTALRLEDNTCFRQPYCD